MHYVLSIAGIILSFLLIKYREFIGDTIGEAAWMKYVGGVYILVVIVAVFIFFWSVAELTNSTNILFAPLLFFLPGGRHVGGGVEGVTF